MYKQIDIFGIAVNSWHDISYDIKYYLWSGVHEGLFNIYNRLCNLIGTGVLHEKSD